MALIQRSVFAREQSCVEFLLVSPRLAIWIWIEVNIVTEYRDGTIQS